MYKITTLSVSILLCFCMISCATKGPAPDEKEDLIQVTDVDEELTFTLLNAAIQCYRVFSYGEVTPPEGWQTAEYFHGDDFFLGEATDEFFGIVFESKTSDEVIIAFRGTSTFAEGIDDVEAEGVAFSAYESQFEIPEDLQVHYGFDMIYQSMQTRLFDILDQYQDSRIYITGHSLGSALSTLFTFDAALSRPDYSILHYNFASPRVGNETFALFFASLPQQEADPMIRFVNEQDLIPKVPLTAEGYEHTARYFSLCFYQKDKKSDILARHYATNYYKALLNYFDTTLEEYPCSYYRPNLPELEFCEE